MATHSLPPRCWMWQKRFADLPTSTKDRILYAEGVTAQSPAVRERSERTPGKTLPISSSTPRGLNPTCNSRGVNSDLTPLGQPIEMRRCSQGGAASPLTPGWGVVRLRRIRELAALPGAMPTSAWACRQAGWTTSTVADGRRVLASPDGGGYGAMCQSMA